MLRKQTLLERIEKLELKAKEREQRRSDEARAQQVATTPQSAERPIRENRIDRNDIIMGLADIARTGKSDGARVSALNNLAEIYLLKAKFIDPKDKLDGWTMDELKDFAVNGVILSVLNPSWDRAATTSSLSWTTSPGPASQKVRA